MNATQLQRLLDTEYGSEPTEPTFTVRVRPGGRSSLSGVLSSLSLEISGLLYAHQPIAEAYALSDDWWGDAQALLWEEGVPITVAWRSPRTPWSNLIERQELRWDREGREWFPVLDEFGEQELETVFEEDNNDEEMARWPTRNEVDLERWTYDHATGTWAFPIHLEDVYQSSYWAYQDWLATHYQFSPEPYTGMRLY